MSMSGVFEQQFRAKWSVWAALGAGCLVGMSGVLLIQRLALRVENTTSYSISKELATLHSSIKELKQEISLMKRPALKPAIRNVTFSQVESSLEYKEAASALTSPASASTVTSTLTEYLSALSSDEEDEYFDLPLDEELQDMAASGSCDELCREVQRMKEVREEHRYFQLVDELMEGPCAQQKQAYQFLLQRKCSLSENADFLWRLCKSMYLTAIQLGQEGDEETKKNLIFEAVDYGLRAIDIDPSSSEAHKWYAIVLGSRGEYLSIKDKILDGYEFKRQVDLAAELAPSDHTIRHLLGRFCYEVAELSWWERKMAATLFADPPVATMQEARDHFLLAEKLKPDGWKENRHYLAKTYLKLNEVPCALQWLQKANELPVKNLDDMHAQKDIEELLKRHQHFA